MDFDNNGKEQKLISQIAETAWNLLNRLPTSDAVMKKVTGFLQDQALNWNELFPQKSKYRLLY